MSKAFDSTQRNIIEDLKNILNQDKLHLNWILLDVKIAAKYGSYKNWFFSTNTGASQYCTSANEFTFYLAISLEMTIANDTLSLEEQNTIQSNYPIVPQNDQIGIDQQ